MHCRRISSVRPLVDETVMSFLGRSQIDADYTDERLHLLAAGVHLPDARMAERRYFDWASLSRFFNASEREIAGLSERQWLFGSGESTPRTQGHAPWARESGYGAHCPCCLKESGHWRNAWLKPDAIVCIRHEALLVRHCPCCDVSLSEVTWSRTLPLCPQCGGHLSLGTRLAAPAIIMEEAIRWSDRFTKITSHGPLHLQDEKTAHWAASWRAARMLVLEEGTMMTAVSGALTQLAGLGTLVREENPEKRALRFAQVSLAAHRIDDLQRAFTEHYWLEMRRRVSSAELDGVIRHQLVLFAHALGIPVEESGMCQAVLSSRASEAGWNLLPIAA